MNGPKVSVFSSEFTVTAYPDPHDPRGFHFGVQLRRHGASLWGVHWMGECFDVDGVGVWEPRPSSRDREFLERFRFRSLGAAMQVAKRVAAELEVNGMTALECWRWQKGEAADG